MNYPPVNMREREETRRVQDTNNQLLGAGSLRCTHQLTQKMRKKVFIVLNTRVFSSTYL